MKIVSRLMLTLASLLVCLSPAWTTQAQAQAQENAQSQGQQAAQTQSGAKVFTYMLRMVDVDTYDGARAYRYETRASSLIGFTGHFTATKRLPYKVGPGKVRVYLNVFPEGDEKTLSVTLGGQKKSTTYSGKTGRYSWEELVFDLDKPYDMLEFEAGSPGAKKARTIWYNTMITNDPALKHVQVARNKFKVLRQNESYTNPPGNLVPNSGFEQGIQNWDVTSYKSNIMVKPSLLQGRAAHYQLGMDVGKIPVTSRWFTLARGQEYNLSYYVADDNAVPVSAVLQSKELGAKEAVVLTLNSGKAEESTVAGWKRASVTFTLPDGAQEEEGDAEADTSAQGSTAGKVRLIFSAEASEAPVLIDSVQITQGQSLLPYALHQGLEVNVISPRTQGIYLLGEPADMYLNLAHDPDVKVQKVSYSVTDYYDQQVMAPTALNINKAGRVPVKLATDKAGMFRVRTHVELTKSGKPQTLVREFFYNVVHPSSPRTDRLTWSLLGGYFTNAPQGPFSYAEVANRFGIYEFNTLGHQMGRWKANMKRDPKDRKKYLRKQYDFSAAERELERFAKSSMNTVVNFHVNGVAGSYGVPFGVNPESGPVFEFKNNVTFAQEDWLHFVDAYVTHFKGRVKRYEVQDEPYQYFKADKYAAFYLATYKAIKKADPDAMVFIHNGHGLMAYIDEVNKLTDGKAHEHMDGVYLYLTQQHSGRISSKAAPEFRAWAKQHKLPILTATCFSGGRDYDTHSLTTSPDYLPEREADSRSIQHLFDGLIWGQAQAFYYYYGSHPSGVYASIFDEYGQVIPMIHFYSAANAMVGDHTSVTSIDTHDALRIGVVETQRNKTYAVLYSVDGKLHTVTAKADTFVQAYDGFGNPADALNKANGQVKLVVGPQPQYVQVNSAADAMAALEQATLQETFDVDFTYEARPQGGLGLRAIITTDQDLQGWTDTKGVYRREVITPAFAKQVAQNMYELKIPLAVSPVNTLNNNHYLNMSTNQGELYANYPHSYAPLLTGSPKVDGQYAAGEWPLIEAQTIPLTGYYVAKGKDVKTPHARGQVSLLRDGKSLYGLAAIFKATPKSTMAMEIAPRDKQTGRVLEDQITRIVIGEKTISVNGQEITDIQLARMNISDKAAAERLKATHIVEFSIPLTALPGIKFSEGLTYGLRITANDPPLADAAIANFPVWYLDAAWPEPQEVEVSEPLAPWGTLLVVE